MKTLIRISMVVLSVLQVFMLVDTNGPFYHMYIWWLSAGVLFLVSRKSFFSDKKDIIMFSYVLLSIIGTLATWEYFSSYGQYFSPYSDDSYYYINMVEYATDAGRNINLNSLSLYEIVGGGIGFIFHHLLGLSFSLLLFLPFQWALAAVCVGVALHLVNDFEDGQGKSPVSFLAYAVLMFHCIYIDTSIHLFRDGMLLLFELLALHFAFRHKYVMAIIFCVLCGMLRFANMPLLLLLLLFLAAYDYKVITEKYYFIFVSILACVIAILLLGSSLKIDFRKGTGTDSIFDTLSARMQTFDEGLQGQSGGTSALMRQGIAGKAVYSLVCAFTPLRYQTPFIVVDEVSMRPTQTGLVVLAESCSIFYWASAFSFLTVCVWIFAIPKIVLFFIISMKSDNNKYFILSLWLISAILTISLISMQARHKTFFIIIFPLIIMLYDKRYHERYHGTENVIRIGCAFLIIAYNIFNLLITI